MRNEGQERGVDTVGFIPARVGFICSHKITGYTGGRWLISVQSGYGEHGDLGSRLEIVVRRMDITLFVARSSTIVSVDDCFE